LNIWLPGPINAPESVKKCGEEIKAVFIRNEVITNVTMKRNNGMTKYL
jgi:hypothetical protein